MTARAAFLALAMAVLLWSLPQQQVRADDTSAIQQVISEQLDAFQRDDGAQAFSYASPGIRRMFGNADNFMRMVRQGYPSVYRPQSFEFREVVEIEGRLVQEVLFVGPTGQVEIASYLMERQPDGSWRINGVVMRKATDTLT